MYNNILVSLDDNDEDDKNDNDDILSHLDDNDEDEEQYYDEKIYDF